MAGRLIVIRGLRLPEGLVSLMESDFWRLDFERSELKTFLSQKVRIFAPELFGIDRIEFKDMNAPNWVIDLFRRQPDIDNPPGDIDFSKTVFIGSFGRADDMIALDFRALAGPPVIYMDDLPDWLWRTAFRSVSALDAFLRGNRPLRA